jgi:hypothetical protein
MARVVSLDKTDVVFGKQSIQWFPWIGTRGLRTLSLLATADKIAHEKDQLSIIYHLPSPEEFWAHIRTTVLSPPGAVALAAIMRDKFAEKFDSFAPEQLLDESNGRSRLDVSGAVESCKAILETSTGRVWNK